MSGFKQSKPDMVFNLFNHILMLVFTLICFYPFYYLFIFSISDPNMVDAKGVFLLPAGFSFINYKQLFGSSSIFNAAFISASRAVVGTIFTIACSSLMAYLLTKKELILRKTLYRFTIITMYISPGLIPWYMLMKTIGLKNNYLLYILPTGVSAFFIVLIKTYIEQLSPSLEESATIDGAGYFTVFIKIIFPLSKPIIATVAIFSAVWQWNAWQDNFYLASAPQLQTLQFMLYNFLASNAPTSVGTGELNISGKPLVTVMSIKMTMSMITVIPILFVYPFMQKYFVKGIMMGAVKG